MKRHSKLQTCPPVILYSFANLPSKQQAAAIESLEQWVVWTGSSHWGCGGCFSFGVYIAWWRVHIYFVWLYLGSREYRLLDQTLAERKRRIGYPYRICRTSVPLFRGRVCFLFLSFGEPLNMLYIFTLYCIAEPSHKRMSLTTFGSRLKHLL